ncbi:MAG: cysteine-rich CWC family protein [Betaproteobacteria bacterium]|nr:cysteine-rich CWC family protein [Betaproteobacteria bacterium]MDH5220525.1 cysteine-rich CWC family protein [Betaproteobacteria bacterium]MDH5350031.1 cysteine-rich CWC family protein [Betaproteobacteria bacterium]
MNVARLQPQPHPSCPVCGGPNECAAASSGSFTTPCWCVEVQVGPDALAPVPAHDRGRACLCRGCLGR